MSDHHNNSHSGQGDETIVVFSSLLTSRVVIGAMDVSPLTPVSDVCVDALLFLSRAKNVSEVLDDATLLLSLTFDQSDLRDTGPLLITRAAGIDYSFTSLARVNVALNLSHPNSFVQITALTRLGISNWPSTFSLWIYPIDRLGGTILQLSQSISTRWCLAILRLSSSGHILMQSSDESSDILFGPVLDLFTWTHVVVTSSSSFHGRRLYINGTPYGRSADAGSGVSMTVTLGSALNRDGGGRCGDE